MKNFTKEDIRGLYEEILYELSLDPNGGFAEMYPESYDSEILLLEFYKNYQILSQMRDCDGSQYRLKTSICEGLEFNSFEKAIDLPIELNPQECIDLMIQGFKICDIPTLIEEKHNQERAQRVLEALDYQTKLKERIAASDKEAVLQKELNKHGKNRQFLPTDRQIAMVDEVLSKNGLGLSQMSAKRQAAFRNACYTVLVTKDISLSQYYCLVKSFAPMPGRVNEYLNKEVFGLINSPEFKNIF